MDLETLLEGVSDGGVEDGGSVLRLVEGGGVELDLEEEGDGLPDEPLSDVRA